MMLKTVKTENGLVRGLPAADPRITSFKGIPFAAPPVGGLRWKAPQPAKNWEGVRDCYAFAPISMQSIPGLNQENIYTREWNVDPTIPMEEDCLYLNVWTPAKSADEKLPVFVWFFGGAFQFGNTAEMEFDGERLARRGIVVVTVNYRLNVFGFLNHPQLTAENPEAPGNFGSLDQQYGLLWTRRNIAAFGGDPENITIGGQSAGGASVMTQLNCPANAPHIKKAIVMSGIFSNPFQEKRLTDLKEAEKWGEEFFRFLGVSTLEEARALPAEYIRDKNDAFGHYWGIVADGTFQKQYFWDGVYEGAQLDVPLMLGFTDNEFFMEPSAQSMGELEQEAQKVFGSQADTYLKLIGMGVPEGMEEMERLEAMKKNAAVCSIELAIRILAHKRKEFGKNAPAFVYEFGPEIPGWDQPGAFHSSDLWFFFETLAKCWRPFTGKHYDLARQMCNYWAQFIKTGDPNGPDVDGVMQENWKPFTEKEPGMMQFYEMPSFKARPAGELMTFLIEEMGK